jgi:mono/diheme cytochrome c family protein
MKLKLIWMGMLTAAVAAYGTVSAQKPKSQWDGVYTAEQAKRGEELYAAKCASCHGASLSGSEMAPALVGGDFAANWNDLSLGDLFERMRMTMPSDDPGSLGRQANADILAFMLQRGSYPVGKTELPIETETLNTYKFLATQPTAD